MTTTLNNVASIDQCSFCVSELTPYVKDIPLKEWAEDCYERDAREFVFRHYACPFWKQAVCLQTKGSSHIPKDWTAQDVKDYPTPFTGTGLKEWAQEKATDTYDWYKERDGVNWEDGEDFITAKKKYDESLKSNEHKRRLVVRITGRQPTKIPTPAAVTECHIFDAFAGIIHMWAL
jgi:hypothetical protein